MEIVSKKQNKKSSGFFVEPVVITLLILLAVVILLVPNLIRPGNISLGSESYFHLRIAEEIQDKGIIGFDGLSFGGRILLTPLGWPLSLVAFSYIFRTSLVQASRLLPFILGLFSVLLFYLILKKINLKKETRTIATIALIISPAFIYLFITSNFYTFAILLDLLAFYLFLYNKRIPTTIVLLIGSIFGLFNSLIFLVLLLIYIIFKKKDALKWFLVTFVLVLLSLVYQNFSLFTHLSLIKTQLFERPESYQNLISDLGGKISLSIFAIIIALLGIVTTWKKKYTYIILHITIILLMILSFYFVPTIFYLNFLLVLIISFGILKIVKRKWESKLIRNFTFLILILGLIFSSLSYINETKVILPDKPTIEGLEFIKEHTKEDEVVFSHYSNGIWINTVAKRKNVVDENFRFAPDLNQRLEDSDKLFYSRDLENTTKIIKKYEIDYIFITPNMKDGLVWMEDEEGLLFILEFSKNFKKIHNSEGVEVWRVVRT